MRNTLTIPIDPCDFLVMKDEAGGRCIVRVTPSGLGLLEQNKRVEDANPAISATFIMMNVSHDSDHNYGR
jgi:hypothetical protein